MPKTSTIPLTTEAAITRARRMIDSGLQLTRAADTVTASRGSDERNAAEQLKDARLLDYRVSTIPEALKPVLEALIRAASANTPSN